jgi:hypothetical protein
MSVGKNVPVQNMSVGKNVPVQNMTVSKNMPVQNISVGKNVPVQNMSVSKNIPVLNIQSYLYTCVPSGRCMMCLSASMRTSFLPSIKCTGSPYEERKASKNEEGRKECEGRNKKEGIRM